MEEMVKMWKIDRAKTFLKIPQTYILPGMASIKSTSFDNVIPRKLR